MNKFGTGEILFSENNGKYFSLGELFYFFKIQCLALAGWLSGSLGWSIISVH